MAKEGSAQGEKSGRRSGAQAISGFLCPDPSSRKPLRKREAEPSKDGPIALSIPAHDAGLRCMPAWPLRKATTAPSGDTSFPAYPDRTNMQEEELKTKGHFLKKECNEEQQDCWYV